MNSYTEKSQLLTGIAINHTLGSGWDIGGGYVNGQLTKIDRARNYLYSYIGYTYPILPELELRTYGSIGKCYTGFVCDFYFYGFRFFPRWKINEYVSLDVLDIRYRNTFDTTNGFEAWVFGVGVLFELPFKNQEIYMRFYKVYDQNFNQPVNGAGLEYKIKF